MVAAKAIYHALELLERPILAGVMQDQSLPPDTLALLKIVAGDEDVINRAALATSRSPRRIQQASVLYIQRILFAPGATHYRVLGAECNAPQAELRERLALLMRWLHPDHTKSDWDSAFAGRVLTAWEALKTPERRRRYDATLTGAGIGQPRERANRPARRIPRIASHRQGRAVSRGRRVGRLALAGVIAAAALFVPDWPITPPHATSPDAPRDASAQPGDGHQPVGQASAGR